MLVAPGAQAACVLRCVMAPKKRPFAELGFVAEYRFRHFLVARRLVLTLGNMHHPLATRSPLDRSCVPNRSFSLAKCLQNKPFHIDFNSFGCTSVGVFLREYAPSTGPAFGPRSFQVSRICASLAKLVQKISLVISISSVLVARRVLVSLGLSTIR